MSVVKAVNTKLVGKEYIRKLSSVEVEVTHYCHTICKNDSPSLNKIWDKRRCFICNGRFKDGEKITIALTKKGTNKIICEKCYLSLPEDKK